MHGVEALQAIAFAVPIPRKRAARRAFPQGYQVNGAVLMYDADDHVGESLILLITPAHTGAWRLQADERKAGGFRFSREW